MSDSPLIATLAAAFVLASLLGYFAARLRMPPLVGYLLAGVLIGPHTPGFVADGELASDLAEVGVVLLMFGVGLHFSVKDLMAVRGTVIPGALLQVVVVTLIGAAVAHAWGWPIQAGLVFGLALSIASTIVLLRSLEERNELYVPEGRLAVGWLIAQDMIAVLAVVLLPALGGPSAGGDTIGTHELILALALTLGKIVSFIVLALVVGTRVVPWMLMQAVRTGSRELFTLAVLAVALGIAWGSATMFGVSLALGAFFAGVILSESPLSHKAGEDSLPLQDAFAVLFFVSVGMLFDVSALLKEPLKLAAVIALIFVANPLVAFLFAIFKRHPVRTALGLSAGLAQTGEFSFILTGLGTSLGILPPQARDLILAGSLISITANPIGYAAIPALYRAISSRKSLMKWLERDGPPRLQSGSEQPDLPSGHVILVGHGRVGGSLSPILLQHGLPLVVVERDVALLGSLDRKTVPFVVGDATARRVLEAAGIDRARLLIVALPDSFQVRRVLEMANELNPHIDTVARTHSEQELRYLQERRVGLIVMGEKAVARSMAEYILRSFGMSDEDVDLAVTSTKPGPSPSGK